jgi:hypothetical protein
VKEETPKRRTGERVADEFEEIPRCSVCQGVNFSRFSFFASQIEHAVFSSMRTMYFPSKKTFEDGTVMQVADLHELYKVSGVVFG